MLLHSFQAQNLLSFGPHHESLSLNKLNLLIGPNGSGKSNLVACLKALSGAASDLTRAFSGGIDDWLHKPFDEPPLASLSVLAHPEHDDPMGHWLCFTSRGGRFELRGERFWSGASDTDPSFVFEGSSDPFFQINGEKRALQPQTYDRNQSILAQRRDPEQYPELTRLARAYEQIRVFSGWYDKPRKPQKVDQPSDFLRSDAGNLAVVLNQMLLKSSLQNAIENCMRAFSGSFHRLKISLVGGYCELFIEETSGRLIPANRMSDGTLRFLCLLTILLHPDPPPLICIEEPELCLHPDIMPTLGKLLASASERTQLIVTTHSETLVSCFSDCPEDVVVCEMDEDVSRFSRLDKADLGEWLERYSLGELWSKGELGGNRW